MTAAALTSESTESTKPRPRWLIGVGAFFVALLTLTLMLSTEPRLAMVWDEGFTLGREARIRLWIEALRDPPGFAARWVPPSPRAELVQQDNPPVPAPRPDEIDSTAKLFGPRAMAYFWPFAREEPHGHPPFYAIVGLLGDLVVPTWADLPRGRFGPIVAFSLASGALFGFIAGRWGLLAGLTATAAWTLQPNLFGHGHYATLDGLLAALWVGAVLTFSRAVEADRRWARWLWAGAVGVLWGWAADTKLTGWFLPIPFVVWAIWAGNRRSLGVLAIAAAVGFVVLFLFNPCWWNNPVSGVERFLRSNLTRGKSIPIPVEFLGQIYNTPRQSLPFYNTVVWTILVTPVGFLLLSLVGASIGAIGAVRRWWPGSKRQSWGDSFAVLVLMHWGFVLVLRALPHTPGHDGVRLFLPGFGMLAMMTSYGAAQIAVKRQFLAWTLAAASCLEGALSVAVMMPTPLAYFSPIVGGLPGAAALGMEPTYFWDGMSDEAIRWLNEHTKPGRSVQFATYAPTWLYLKQTGQLQVQLRPFDPGPAEWFVLQNRPGALEPWQRRLIQSTPPAYQVSKFGVPLVLIYPMPR